MALIMYVTPPPAVWVLPVVCLAAWKAACCALILREGGHTQGGGGVKEEAGGQLLSFLARGVSPGCVFERGKAPGGAWGVSSVG